MKQLPILFLTGLFLLFGFSCIKPVDNADIPYPKQVAITYKVSSTSVNSLVSITYDNETGGKTTIDNPTLPYTKTINKIVSKYDIITLGYFVNPAQTVKLEIIVYDGLVKSQVFTSANASMSYTFQ